MLMFLISRSSIVSLLHWIEYLRVDWRFDPSCMFSHSGAARARDKEKEKNPESVLSFTFSRVPKTWTRLLRDMKFDQEFDFQGNLANNYSCATRIFCNMHLKCMLWCKFKRLDQISYSIDHKNGCVKSTYKRTYLALAFDDISNYTTWESQQLVLEYKVHLTLDWNLNRTEARSCSVELW